VSFGKMLVVGGTIAAPAVAYYQYRSSEMARIATEEARAAAAKAAYEASAEFAVEKALHKLEAEFSTHPESTPIAKVEEKYWLPRDEGTKKQVHDILFEGSGRLVVVGTSGSGKTSTVKMVAREAKRSGIVFVDLKGMNAPGDVLEAFAKAFEVDQSKVVEAVPRAVREFHQKTGRFAIIIIEDAQGALRTSVAEKLLQQLARCADDGALNLVFLTSEGGLPSQLRSMSGWGNAFFVKELRPIHENTMRQHLEQVWHMDPTLASSLVEQVGSGARDIFEGALKACTPGGSIDESTVKANTEIIIAQSRESIMNVVVELKGKERDKAFDYVGMLPAGVLLLDHLLTVPAADTGSVYRAHVEHRGKQWPPWDMFDFAAKVLVDKNILHKEVSGKVTWHRRAVRTAYQSLQETDEFKAIRSRQK
jgi:type II secretory pathway predicted ATPase ExeA